MREKKKVEKKVAKKEVKEKPKAKKEVKKVAKKVSKPVVKKATPKKPVAKKSTAKPTINYRTYHLAKRESDGKWQVKYAGGEKAIKLFNTKEEALKYANQMAKNQDGSVLVHASKGKNKGKIRSK